MLKNIRFLEKKDFVAAFAMNRGGILKKLYSKRELEKNPRFYHICISKIVQLVQHVKKLYMKNQKSNNHTLQKFVKNPKFLSCCVLLLIILNIFKKS